MENKQLTNTKLAYENLQEDYNSLRLQVKPNILSILADEMSSAGNGFKKLQLQHQVTLSQLNDALNDCKEQSRKNDQLEEENYTLKKDNNALLKEKNELRLMHKDEVSSSVFSLSSHLSHLYFIPSSNTILILMFGVLGRSDSKGKCTRYGSHY
jgi:hypothetical protein